MMTLAGSGLAAPRRNSSSEAAGMPRASSAWHITGSQATVAVRLTWPAAQAAAWPRIAASSALAWLPLPAAAVAWRAVAGRAVPGTAVPGTAVAGPAVPGTALAGPAVPGIALAGIALMGIALAGTALMGTALAPVALAR